MNENLRIINWVKILIEPLEFKDEFINLQIEIVKRKIQIYCNRTDLPEELEIIIAEIVSIYCKNSIQYEYYQKTNTPESIKRGDTEIRFSSSKETRRVENKLFNSIFLDYEEELKSFILSDRKNRKIRFL